MGKPDRHVFDLTVDAAGDATVYTNGVISGTIEQVTYVPDGTAPLDTGADITITGEDSTMAIITITNFGTALATFAPRQVEHDVASAPALYAAAGEAVKGKMKMANERIKVVVAQGGVSKTGKLHIVTC